MFKAILICALVDVAFGGPGPSISPLDMNIGKKIIESIMDNSVRGPTGSRIKRSSKERDTGEALGLSPFLKDSITKSVDYAVNGIDGLIVQKQNFSLAVSDGKCNSDQIVYSSMISDSVKKMLLLMIASQQRLLSTIEISEMPVYSETFSQFSKVRSLKLKNILLKGVQGITVSKFEFDICAKKYVTEIKIPYLEIKADYNLDGEIDLSPIVGKGKFTIKIDSLSVYQKTSMDCKTVLFAEDVCKFSSKTKTIDLAVRSITVDINGLKYKRLTEKQINDGIKTYINDIIKSNKLGIVQTVENLILRFKAEYLNKFSPVSLLQKLKNDLKRVPSQLDSTSKTLLRGNIYENLLYMYI